MYPARSSNRVSEMAVAVRDRPKHCASEKVNHVGINQLLINSRLQILDAISEPTSLQYVSRRLGFWLGASAAAFLLPED